MVDAGQCALHRHFDIHAFGDDQLHIARARFDGRHTGAFQGTGKIERIVARAARKDQRGKIRMSLYRVSTKFLRKFKMKFKAVKNLI